MIEHEVKPGENLSKIRAIYGLNFVPFETIQKFNPIIKDPALIQPGWKIKLPTAWAELKAIKTIQFPKLKTIKKIPLPEELRPSELPWKEWPIPITKIVPIPAELRAEPSETIEQKIKDFLGFSSTSKGFKELAIKEKNLTSEAAQSLRKLPMWIKPSTKGWSFYLAPLAPLWPAKLREKMPSAILVQGDSNDVIFHEFLHSQFDKKEISILDFNRVWDNTKKKEGETGALHTVDKWFQTPSYFLQTTLVPYTKATERYAGLGMYGSRISEYIPKDLQQFYLGIWQD